MEPGPRFQVGDWELGLEIGRGAYATVYRGRHAQTGQEVAVKEIITSKLSPKLKQSLEGEISILRRVKHENIVQLYDVLQETGKFYLVMEYCSGGDLAGYIRNHKACQQQRSSFGIPEATAQAFMQQLASGLRALWDMSLVHRDLKPQNLLLSCEGPGAVLKIADFGFARNLHPENMALTMCGSPLYMAPEILNNRQYDSKADLWSVGAILFELLVGVPPFNAPNHYILMRQLQAQEAKVPDDLAAAISQPCKALLQGLLKKNPFERMSFDEFFSHPFLRSPRRASEACPSPEAACPPGSTSTSSSMSSSQSTQLGLDGMSGSTSAPGLAGLGFPADSDAGRRERERPHGPLQAPVPSTHAVSHASQDSAPRQRSRDEPPLSSRKSATTATATASLRPTLVAMPGSRFAPLASSCLPPLPHGPRLADRATSLPSRLPPAVPDEDEEDYVIIPREATPSPSTSSHGSSGRGGSASLGNSGSSVGHGRGPPPKVPVGPQGGPVGSLRATAVSPMALHMAPGSFALPHPSTAAHPSAGFARSQTLPPRMPVFDPASSVAAALVNNGTALNWLAAGGVDRLEGLRQVCHAMESLALSAAAGPEGPRAALALRVMSLQVLQVACDEGSDGPAPSTQAQQLILSDMRVITARAEQAVSQMGGDVSGEMPDVWELIYRGALGLAQDAGARECLGDFGSSRKLYMRAGALLYFMLAEAPNLKLMPPLDIRGEERARLQYYTSQIRLRHACCTAIIDAAASASVPVGAAIGAVLSAAGVPRPASSPS